MWLSDKVYELKSISGERLKNDSSLTLLVNGKQSGLQFEKLSIIIDKEFPYNKFRAFSILENLEKGENGNRNVLEIEGNKYNISFIDPSTGLTFEISNIKNYWFQKDDKEIKNESVDEVLKTIIETVAVSKEESSASKSEEDKGKEPAQPQAGLIPDYNSPSYEKDKQLLINKKYNEVSFPNTQFKNFRVLHKNFEDPKVVEILENKDFNIIPLKLTDESNFFSFTDSEDKVRYIRTGDSNIILT